MNSVQKYARFLRLLFLIIGIPLIVISFILKWFCKSIITYNNIKYSIVSEACLNPFMLETKIVPSVMIRFLSAAVDGISVILFLWGCICFIGILNHYSKGELFSEKIINLYRKIGRIALAWTVYNPLKFTLLSVLTTINNPAGQRLISVCLRGEDIFHILIVGFFIIINSLMREAYELKREQDLTV